MVNITTTEMHEIAAIIDSIDCQRHMLACGIKDTEYLVQQFLHQMKALILLAAALISFHMLVQ